MTQKHWLVFTHAANSRDYGLAKEALRRMQQNLDRDTTVFSIFFGPTLKSVATLEHHVYNECFPIASEKNETTETALDITIFFTEIIQNILSDARDRVSGVCIWSHGSGGSGIGVWKKWKTPFMSCVDLVRTIIKPFQPRIVCFDACYQGSISCLFELVGVTDIVVASPGFHPFCSILWTKAFGELSKIRLTKREIENYAHNIACEWHSMTGVYYKCLLVFDMAVIPEMAAAVKENWDHLIFDERSQIDKEDANLHDIFIAARNVSIVQRLANKSISQVTRQCLTCRPSCTRWVNGPSVEARLLRKWQHAYVQTAWYNYIRGKRGYHDRRLIHALAKRSRKGQFADEGESDSEMWMRQCDTEDEHSSSPVSTHSGDSGFISSRMSSVDSLLDSSYPGELSSDLPMAAYLVEPDVLSLWFLEVKQSVD
ncbi:hypothetical protein R1sor_026042 [Riccia sorocarpa]|uniref:Uncharacterized protein n=1 Tax=Riccia sorocarpa TaxID=122646 RepID=A0ABD3GCC2_9MARC